MGIIIETPGFIPYYSGYKNLKLLAGLNNKISKQQVREAMKKVGLDKDGVKEMREYLLSYKEQGKTILICSHSAEDISVLCETVHEMDKGRLGKQMVV